MKIQLLKCEHEFFLSIRDGQKNFEIRKNDRDYAVGDLLILREYDSRQDEYSGELELRLVSYMTSFKQEPDHVVLALMPVFCLRQ